MAPPGLVCASGSLPSNVSTLSELLREEGLAGRGEDRAERVG